MTARARIVSWCLLAGALPACGPQSFGVRTTPETLAAESEVRTALTIERTLDPATFPAGSVGVLPLRILSSDPTLAPLGHGLADLLMTDLARSAQVQVVDRLRIQALLRELRLVELGVAEADSGPRFGRILGARHLLLGSVAADRGADVRVSTSLARTEDATVRPIVSGVASLDDILDAEKALALEVFQALGVNLTPAERAAVEQRPTRNLAALLAFSRGLRAEAELQWVRARQEYREAIRLDRVFRAPRERLSGIEVHFPDPLGIASISVDALNRPHLPSVSDVTDPAFQGRQRAILIIPITVP